jgi:hypothetical protein
VMWIILGGMGIFSFMLNTKFETDETTFIPFDTASSNQKTGFSISDDKFKRV